MNSDNPSSIDRKEPGTRAGNIPEPDSPGLGLRREHYEHILSGGMIQAEWFEAITENYMDSRGRPRRILRKVREDFPLALHGVSMSVASADLFSGSGTDHPRGPGPELTQLYLKRQKELIEEIQPFIVSDHLCWTRSGNIQSHDLLPVAFSKSWLDLICENVNRIQSCLNRRIALENVSSYIGWQTSEMKEWEFLNEVSHRTGCGILLDINNISVNAHNHGLDAESFIREIRPSSVMQYHIAGHEIQNSIRFDTHGQSVSPEVQFLYDRALECIGPRPILLERDQDIPALPELERELMEISRKRDNAEPIEMSNVPNAFYLDVTENSGSRTEKSAALNEARDSADAQDAKASSAATDSGEKDGEAKACKEGDLTPSHMQSQFLDAIFSGKLSRSTEAQLRGTGVPLMDPLQSLNVYRESVLSRLMDSLEETFAPLKALESQWFEWFKDYIESLPPRHYNLSDFGHALAGSIGKENPVARDLARLCFLNVRYFHGQRPGGAWIPEATDAAPESKSISTDIALLTVSREALKIWMRWKKSSQHPASEGQAMGARVHLLFFRDTDKSSRIRELKSAEASILTGLLRKHSLENCMHWIAENHPEVEQDEIFSFFQFLSSHSIALKCREFI